MDFHEKVDSLVHNSTGKLIFFEMTITLFSEEVLYAYFLFVKQDIKKSCTQRLRLNKINTSYWFLR